MIQSFAYDALPGRVVLVKAPSCRLALEVDTLGFKRALVLTTPQQTEQGDAVAAMLGPRFGRPLPGPACTCRSTSSMKPGRRLRRAAPTAFLPLAGLDHGARQGAGAPNRSADCRRANHLCRLGNEPIPGMTEGASSNGTRRARSAAGL